MRLLAGTAVAAVVAIALAAAVVVSHRGCGARQAAGQIASSHRLAVVGWETGDDTWVGVHGEITRSGFTGQGDTTHAVPRLDGVDQLTAWTSSQHWGYIGGEDLTREVEADQTAGRWVPEMLRVGPGCRPVGMMFVQNSHAAQSFRLSDYT